MDSAKRRVSMVRSGEDKYQIPDRARLYVFDPRKLRDLHDKSYASDELSSSRADRRGESLPPKKVPPISKEFGKTFKIEESIPSEHSESIEVVPEPMQVEEIVVDMRDDEDPVSVLRKAQANEDTR